MGQALLEIHLSEIWEYSSRTGARAEVLVLVLVFSFSNQLITLTVGELYEQKVISLVVSKVYQAYWAITGVMCYGPYENPVYNVIN